MKTLQELVQMARIMTFASTSERVSVFHSLLSASHNALLQQLIWHGSLEFQPTQNAVYHHRTKLVVMSRIWMRNWVTCTSTLADSNFSQQDSDHSLFFSGNEVYKCSLALLVTINYAVAKDLS